MRRRRAAAPELDALDRLRLSRAMRLDGGKPAPRGYVRAMADELGCSVEELLEAGESAGPTSR